MISKFKVGDKVSFIHNHKKYCGIVKVIDLSQMYKSKDNYQYDIYCNHPEKVLFKHITESDLTKRSMERCHL